MGDINLIRLCRFDKAGFSEALRNKELEPLGLIPRSINIDHAKYSLIGKKFDRLDLYPIRKRTGNHLWFRLRQAIGFTLRQARRYNPVYKFFSNEIVNEDWLGMVDWHKFHRDHIIHQPMCVYVGFQLIDLIEKKPSLSAILKPFKCKYLTEYLREIGAPEIYYAPDRLDSELTKELWKDLFKEAFFLAALFHDSGYPWRFINIVRGKLGEKSNPADPTGRGLEWIMRNYGQRLLFYPFSGYRKQTPTEPGGWQDKLKSLISDCLTATHGLPGALSMLYLYDQIRKFPDEYARPPRPMASFCIEWAAMAVMMHDMADIYWGAKDHKEIPKNPQLRLSLDRDPLSFLLTLTDLLQDFSRPDATFPKINSDGVYLKYIEGRCESVKLEELEDSNTLKITYVYNNKEDYIKNKADFIPHNQERYFDPNYGYLDVKSMNYSRILLEAELL